MASFVTVDDYQALTQTVLADTELAALQGALDAACAAIQTYTEQEITYAEHDVAVVNGTGRNAILVPQLPIVAVHAVNIGGSVTSLGAIVDGEDVTTQCFVGFGGVLYRAGPDAHTRFWPIGWGNILVEYDHGYVEIPADLKHVACMLAKRAQTGARLTPGLKSETIGPFSYTRDDSADASGLSVEGFEKILDRYVRKRVPVA